MHMHDATHNMHSNAPDMYNAHSDTHHVTCMMSCVHSLRRARVSHHACACISPAGEMFRKNKHPGKCNLLWARKVLEIFKYSDHFSGTEYAGNSLYILIFFHFRISVE